MSDPNPRLVVEGGTTTLPPWSFGTVLPADESAEHEFDYLNDGASAETITEAGILVLWSTDGGVTFGQDNAPCLERWVEIQAYDAEGTGIEAQTTAWTPVGVGARLRLKPIPADCRRKLRARIKSPAGWVFSAEYQVAFVAFGREGYIALSQGFEEAGIRGVVGGTGDPDFSSIFSGGTIEATGTPDSDVHLTDVIAFKSLGRPLVLYPDDYTIAASASGNARWVTLSAGNAGFLTVTEQDPEVAAPAPIAGRPAPPEGEEVVAWVHRDDGTIASGDIYPAVTLGFYGLSLDGLDATIGKGAAIVDNRLVWRDSPTPFTLADDEVTTFYVNIQGVPEAVTSGNSPSSSRALPIHEVTVAGGVVVDNRDLRPLLGPRLHTFTAFWPGAAVADDAVYWTSPRDKRLAVRLPHGVELSAGTIGGRTTGALVVELEYWDGAAWTSLFSDPARLPQLAYNASPPLAGGFLPDLTDVAAGTRLRLRIDTLPTGGSGDPEDVFARVEFEEVGL